MLSVKAVEFHLPAWSNALVVCCNENLFVPVQHWHCIQIALRFYGAQKNRLKNSISFCRIKTQKIKLTVDQC